MGLRIKADEVKGLLSAEQVKSKIENDLGISETRNKKYICFLHSDDSKNPNMSFDADKKSFHCFRCGQTYDIFEHYMDYNNISFVEAIKLIVSDFSLNLCLDTPKRDKPKVLPTIHKQPLGVVLEYIRIRGISDKTINYVGLKMDKGNVVFEYRDENGQHLANKYRPARKIQKGENKNFWQGSMDSTLYNMDKINITEPLVICEGEFDCLSLIKSGYKNVVSVPAGAKGYSWVDKNWEWLEQFDEITLWFDNDDAGKEGIQIISKRLENVTKIVYCTIANDINEVLFRFGKDEVIKQLNNAIVLDVDGVITASQIENFNVYEAEKIKSGIKIIDANILGFVLGSLNVITGYNGSGKSTLINQMCIAESISQGYKVFAFSGELTPSNFKYWLYSTIVNDKHLELQQTRENNKYYKIGTFAEEMITNWIDDKLFLYNKTDYTEKSILTIMEQLAKRKGVKVFVIDNLMKIELDDSRNELTAQKKLVNKLKMFAIKYNAIVHLVAHPRKPQMTGQRLDKFDVAGTGDITNLADYVIGVHRTSQEEADKFLAEQEKSKVCKDPRDASITLFKDRPTGSSEKEANLYFDKKRKRFYNNEYDLNKEYGYVVSTSQECLDDMPF